MKKRTMLFNISILAVLILLLSACASATPIATEPSTTVSATATQTSTNSQTSTSQVSAAPTGGNPPSGALPNGSPPSGSPPSGNPPSGSSGSTSSNQGLSTATGAYTLDGQTASETDQTYTASEQDQSAVYVINGGNLTLDNVTINTSGNSSSNDNSSFYGLNAAVLATSGSTIKLADSSVSTTGSGANGVFATGEGSSVSLSNVTINATGGGGHGVMATQGGSMNLTNVDITTAGANSASIATDRGGGTITSSGGTVTSSGADSPCLYSTGRLVSTNLTCIATGSESVVIEGANSITLTVSSLTSSIEDKWGVMIYQSMSGDAQGTEGEFNMTGGSLTNSASSGPLFFVTNTTAYINLSAVRLSAGSGVLVQVAGTDRWGTSGSNGGTVNLTADKQTLTGNLVADSISNLTISLENGSTLEGTINAEHSAKSANITLDKTSSWTVTADSYITCLNDADGISGTTMTNIIGNGHTVYYNASACSALGGQTYTLVGGGYLKPAG
ncbi:MAG: hypothetical protein C3F13_03385 [Anaerolineales bacterium]|nr:hypothetical protein [Anaerolineae bacterium]PWB55728.1 MAG: hypothetical protein C3F13_03385 [Anaerolineales bacterium]